MSALRWSKRGRWWEWRREAQAEMSVRWRDGGIFVEEDEEKECYLREEGVLR